MAPKKNAGELLDAGLGSEDMRGWGSFDTVGHETAADGLGGLTSLLDG